MILHRALQLMVFSAGPLDLKEIAEAVIITPGVSEIDEDDRLQRPEDLLDIGKSLFTQSSSLPSTCQIFELSHYSVKEYLLSDRIRRGPAAAFAINELDAELRNTNCLLTYLGLDVLQTEWQDFEARIENSADLRVEAENLLQEQNQRLANYPLLSYAARYCLGHHCKSETVQKRFSSLIVDLFMSSGSGRFYIMEHICVYNAVDPVASLERLFRYSLLNVAAELNLSVIVHDLLTTGVPVDALPSKPCNIKQYPEGQTALYKAACSGHVNMCEMLIKAGANVEGTESCDCPLSAACRSGKLEIVRLMLDAGANVRNDARPLSETQLAIWWRYIEEKNQKWQDILDVLRDAGARWSTVALLSAFSKITKKLISRAADLLLLDSNDDSLTNDYVFDNVTDDIDFNTLVALQWLVQDEGGVTGLRSKLKTTLRVAYENQPRLFIPVSGFMTSKFTAEEMIAENLIRTYFQPATMQENPRSQNLFERSEALLNTLWDNVSKTDKATTFNSSNLEGNQDFVVCGEILQAWNRARWDNTYSHFFD